jgi:hypothetical protein
MREHVPISEKKSSDFADARLRGVLDGGALCLAYGVQPYSLASVASVVVPICARIDSCTAL